MNTPNPQYRPNRQARRAQKKEADKKREVLAPLYAKRKARYDAIMVEFADTQTEVLQTYLAEVPMSSTDRQAIMDLIDMRKDLGTLPLMTEVV